ncbi:hypothetical protein [Halobellus litoreus]|uniref:Helix-hairpin-helix motif-containing protein n=1 Tax=Halobellus litoreus TaxID=755310 RepID=A0ABD6DZ42_9EURY|nr:hypothetical protein [Halobellus litoreus]
MYNRKLVIYGLVAVAVAGMIGVTAATVAEPSDRAVNHTGSVEEVSSSKGTSNISITAAHNLPNESAVDSLEGTPVSEIVDRPRGTTFGELTADEMQTLKEQTVLGTYSDEQLAAIQDSAIGAWSASDTSFTARVTTTRDNSSDAGVSVQAPEKLPEESVVKELPGTPVTEIVDAPRETTFANLSASQQDTLRTTTALSTLSDEQFEKMVESNEMQIGSVSVLNDATDDEKIWYTAQRRN